MPFSTQARRLQRFRVPKVEHIPFERRDRSRLEKEAHVPFERSHESRNDRDANFPFERQPGAKPRDSYAELELEGSTITPKERKAFESLLSLQKSRSAAGRQDGKARVKEGGEATPAAGLDAMLAAEGGKVDADGRRSSEMPEALRALVRESRQKKSEGLQGTATQAQPVESLRETSGPVISQAASKELHSVSKAIETATTDAQVWQVLHERVLSRLPKTDSLPLTNTRKQRAKVKEGTPTPEHSIANNETKVAPLLAETLATHLTQTFTHLATSFPTSHLPLNILPTLKTFPLSVQQLGASTKLYNQHMRLLYERYADNPGIVDMLAEMEAHGVGFDSGTLEVLDDVLVYAREAGRGEHGAGVRIAWEMERTRGALRETVSWRRRIVERVEEEAIRLARVRDGEML